MEIINKPLFLHLVGYLYYWQMGFNSVFKGLNRISIVISEKIYKIKNKIYSNLCTIYTYSVYCIACSPVVTLLVLIHTSV